MSTFAPLGPKRPIKKPRPMQINCTDGIAFIDSEDSLIDGTEIFVCEDEQLGTFVGLQSGNYTLETGEAFVVIDGIIDEIY